MGRNSAGPAFSGRGRGRTSLGPREGRGRGRGGRRPLNANYFGGSSGGGSSLADSRAQELAKQDNHELEATFGFPLFTDGPLRLGWLLKLNSTVLIDKASGQAVSAVNLYFMCQDGSMFKAQREFCPYFYVSCKEGKEPEVDSYLRRLYQTRNAIKDIEVVHKEDLDLKNHLSGLKRKLLKVSFRSVQHLMDVRRELLRHVYRNSGKSSASVAYTEFGAQAEDPSKPVSTKEAMDYVLDLKEADVPYHIRFCIDEDIRCGLWYEVKAQMGQVSLTHRPDILKRAEPRICAFDIETTKLPLQFPNAEFDQVFMISYMIDREGFLIVNRSVVGKDISSFEYTPKPEFEGPFTVWNEPDEEATLRRWFRHMQQVKPAIYVTYNGDFFDWPFIETRAGKLGMDMQQEIGFKMSNEECLSRSAIHMDCLHWVNRDSYLPQGSRGLKNVTKEKLGYNPIEVDPEDMMRFAAEDSQTMASYSVSDAVATYYLYMSYIHPFIFSLSTVIPMEPDEVLRKGSGTLCEMLLMVEAYKANVVAPNKHVAATEVTYKGHMLKSETYIGGKVEALQSGVFRSDLPTQFRVQPSAYQELVDSLDNDLRFAIEVEGKMSLDDIENYEEVKAQIQEGLEALRDKPVRQELPLIYHLDVAAMYPNIILTNRLQPSAIVTEEDCAACIFNKPGKTCLRTMKWVWRGEPYAATTSEYFGVKNQLASEMFPPQSEGGPPRSYDQLPHEERGKLLEERLKKYCQKAYGRARDKFTYDERHAGICMRENDFYVSTVRAFRDRRYEYKGKNKEWKKNLEARKAEGNPIQIQEAEDMVVLFDSLQLAHKCILNSFYGYVMRKGARWYSMEMAGVVTNTGAEIIQRAAKLVTQIGLPLELDTDGIWCCLPGSFPENFKFKGTKKDLSISYPCVMLNVMVAKFNTNDQYQDLVDPAAKTYKTSSQMSIEFEVDGPYKAMVLPASKKEGKSIKKRYAVFNLDGTLAELKGFELKRRGELMLIKEFQREVFTHFLEGATLQECYDAVGSVGNRWLDLLDTQGRSVVDAELISYISESSTMSKSVDEYDQRKGVAITTARRLAEFLGDERIKDKGLNCNYVIAKRPESQPVSDRAVPVAIFSTTPAVARAFLKKWCGEIPGGSQDEKPDIRDILDWGYYKERLGGTIQKIVTIPAALQKIVNPVPRVEHPDWLRKQLREKDDPFRQRTLDGFFKSGPAKPASHSEDSALMDIEDGGQPSRRAENSSIVAAVTRLRVGSDNVENAGDLHNQQAEEAADDGPYPGRWEDPEGWLKYMKRVWSAERAALKKRRAASKKRNAEGNLVPPPPKGTGVKGFFQQQAFEAASSAWQIIQVAETHQPGSFRVWALVENRLYCVPLTVPRTFFVDSLLPPADKQVSEFTKQVRKTLPEGRKPHHLYQVVVDEREFRGVAAGEWAERLKLSHVQGVWEERLPLKLHAILTLGCSAELMPAFRSRPFSDGFTLGELSMKSTAECPYLEGEGPEGLGCMRQMCMYHSRDAGVRGVWALHIPANSRIDIVLVSTATGKGAKTVSTAAAESFWTEALAGAQNGSRPEMDVSLVPSHAEAMKALNKILGHFRERHRGPAIVSLEAPGGSAWLSKEIPLLSDLPVVEIAPHSADSAYPSLDWQSRAVRTALARIASAPPILQEQAMLARYSHIPMGNIGRDSILETADALFARCLRDAGHLLWISDPSLQDIAGRATGDGVEDLLWKLQVPTEVVYPGAYRSICVKLEIHHLALTAIEQSSILSDLEGLGSVPTQQGCGAAFRVLKTLVHRWLLDVTDHGNRIADVLLNNLWRWLCSSSSALGLPALQETVAALMHKVLAHLVFELKKLGAVVIAGDASSIVIATGKHSLHAATGYVDYLLKALWKQELYRWLMLKPVQIWHTLIFRDRHNFMGVKAKLPSDVLDAIGAKGKTQDELLLPADLDAVEAAEEPEYDVHWDIKEYLPRAVQSLFLEVVADFVVTPWLRTRHLSSQNAGPAASQAVVDAKAADEVQSTWLKRHMDDSFNQRVMAIVADIRKNVVTTSGQAEHQFPKLAGSHLSEAELGTPAKAFTRTICEIMTLDETVAEEVARLRGNLLAIARIREYSDEAVFREPSRTYLLRDVICGYCNACTDLDLCRDPSLQARNWECEVCGHERSIGGIEARLLVVVRRLLKAFQLQDTRCHRCKECAGLLLERSCRRCGGSWRNAQPDAELRSTIAVLHNFAEYHEFQLLLETTEWVLHGNV